MKLPLPRSRMQTPRRSPKPPRQSAKSVSGPTRIALEAGGGLMFWEIAAGQARPIDGPPAGDGLLFRAGEQDHRKIVERGMSSARRKRTAMMELSDKASVVSPRWAKDVIHFTSRSHVLIGRQRIAPLSAFLDVVRQNKKEPVPLPAVIGFYLQDALNAGSPGERSVLALWLIQKDGSSSRVSVNLNPGDIGERIRKFAAENKLASEPAHIILDAAQLSQMLQQAVLKYPVEDEMGGIPLRKIRQGAAIGALAWALGSTVFAFSMIWLKKAEIAKEDVLQSRMNLARQGVANTIKGHILGFAQGLSIDYAGVIQDAQQLWMPGTRVLVDADSHHTVLRLEAPLELKKQESGIASAALLQPLDQLIGALRKRAPAGYIQSNVETNGMANVYYIDFSKQQNDPLFGRFRGH